MLYDHIIWGKLTPRCALSTHMICVGACIRVYLEAPSSKSLLRRLAKWLGISRKSVKSWISYFFSLHDIGKTHPDFQFRDMYTFRLWQEAGYSFANSKGDNTFRHEIYSTKVIKDIWVNDWAESGLPPISAQAQSLFLAAIRLHHQGKSTKMGTTRIPQEWHCIQSDLEQRMRRQFLCCDEMPEPTNKNALGILLTALMVLSDWVASSEDFGVFTGDGDEACLAWAMKSAESILNKYGLISNRECAFPDAQDFCGMWPQIPPNSVRPLQASCQALNWQNALLTIIEAPMGEGKTEAALYIAGRICAELGLHGVYMALPTAATSNQMVGRVRALLKTHELGDVRLLHGTAWMLDELSPIKKNYSSGDEEGESRAAFADWLRPLRRGMLSENAVGTVDQAMAAVLRLKYGMLRLAGLANKVLIIDEIHAYDEYMSEILMRLLQWCRQLEIPVILLSATLQKRQKEAYLSCYGVKPGSAVCNTYPLITRVGTDTILHETPVCGTAMHQRYVFSAKGILGDAEATARLAMSAAERGGCICVMMNTVKQAQQVYRALQLAGEKNLMLFHARYKWKQRARIEKTCLELFGRDGMRPKRMILVCTQVVEQSLDVDFDMMITEIAPVDLLLQRAGRVHRHLRPRPAGFEDAQIIVLTPPSEASDDVERRYGHCGAVYAPCVLWSTEKWLGDMRSVRVPDDIRSSVDSVYMDFGERALISYLKRQAQIASDRAHADGCVYPEPNPSTFFGALRSNAGCFSMDEQEEMDGRSLFLMSSEAKTRLGDKTVHIAFLPRNFSASENARETSMRIFDESCSIRLTEISDSIDTLVLREDAQEDGIYRLGRIVFHADDDEGVWLEVKEI